MTRGIHLKRLKTEDITVLGVPESALLDMDYSDPNSGIDKEVNSDALRLRLETVREIGAGLEQVLALLEEALAAVGTAPRKSPKPQVIPNSTGRS